MPTTPTGPYALAMSYLEDLIVESATFRNSIATGTSKTDARARVYWPGTPEPAPTIWPFAVIRNAEGQSLSFNHSGAGGGYPNYPLTIMLENAASASDTPKERLVKFLNWVGAIVKEMNAVARTPGFLEVTEFVLASWSIAGNEENKVYDQAVLELKVFG